MELTQVDAVFHALSNPNRRMMVERLSAGPATVTDLAAGFDMQLPSFVQHLGILEGCGLVTSAKQGRVRTYKLAPEQFLVMDGWLADRRREWEARLDRFDQVVLKLKEEEETQE